MAGYPETIVLQRGSEEFDFLTRHSGLIETLANDNEPTLELTADLLFNGDQTKWQNFIDLFFPEKAVRNFFSFKNNNIYVLPDRGGREALIDMLDFFMVNTPSTMMNFAKRQARKQLNAPPNTVTRGVGIRVPGRGARAYAARQARLAPRNNFGNNFGNNNNVWVNEGSVENTRPDVRVNNNGAEAYEEAENEENNGAANVVRTNNNRGTFGRSAARAPTVSLANLLTLASTKKKKGPKKGGSKKRRQTRRYKK